MNGYEPPAFFTRPDDDIDAPNVVRNLSLVGLGCLVLGAIAYGLLANSLRGYGVDLVIAAVFCALCFWITSLAMVWSSKYGKLEARERLVDALDLHGDEIVLDMGCGLGLLFKPPDREKAGPGNCHRFRSLAAAGPSGMRDGSRLPIHKLKVWWIVCRL